MTTTQGHNGSFGPSGPSQKIGQAAILTSKRTKFWPVASQTAAKTTNKKPEPQLVHPIFVKYAEHISQTTNDNYWIDRFKDAAKGRFPKNCFTYQQNILTYKHKKKHEQIVLSEDIAEAAAQCIEFFGKHERIVSDMDEKRIQENVKNYQGKRTCEHSWSEIKKKKIRLQFISIYISELSEERLLNAAERSQLERLIHAGFLFGVLNNNNILFENGKIVHISGVVFDSHSKKYVYDLDEINANHLPHNYVPVKKYGRIKKNSAEKYGADFRAKWEKQLQAIEKDIKILPEPRMQIHNQCVGLNNGSTEMVTSPRATTTDITVTS